MIYIQIIVLHGCAEGGMRILIVGASGYLGARFARHFHEAHPKSELFLASTSGACQWLNGLGSQLSIDLDGQGPIKLPDKIDSVIHLAAINEHDCADVSRAVQINVKGTWQLIESAIAHNIKNFVYASTIHVYGPLNGDLFETSPVKTVHPYGFTHHMSEQLFEYAAAKFNISATCLRFSNVFGAPANMQVNRWTLLVNDLCRQAVQSKKMVLKSPESQRDFLAMPDACSAFEKAVLGYQEKSGFKVFNISSGKNVSVKVMADLIAQQALELLGEKIEIITESSGVATSGNNFLIHNSKAKSWGWTPKAEFAGEITSTLKLCAGANRG
jgi:UDP-glucose 4-epimerase